MRSNKSFMIEVDSLKQIQDLAGEEKRSFNDMVNIIVRHGLIRFKQELKERAVLAPIDDEKHR